MPGAGTNYERKKYRKKKKEKRRKKYRKLPEKLLRLDPTFKKEGTKESANNTCWKRGKSIIRRWQT